MECACPTCAYVFSTLANVETSFVSTHTCETCLTYGVDTYLLTHPTRDDLRTHLMSLVNIPAVDTNVVHCSTEQPRE